MIINQLTIGAMRTPLPLMAAGALGALVLAGCSTNDTSGDAPSAGSTSGAASSGAVLAVGASFYPLQFIAERVGGDLASVTSLAPPGVEPHDMELSPSAVRSMQDMDTVLFMSDFAPAVDDAIDTTGVRSVDAHAIVDEHGADVAAHAEGDHEGHDHATDDEHADDDHADESTEDDGHEGHDHGAADPHFWLDPTLVAELAEDVAAEFAELDPDNAQVYEDNAAALRTDMDALDASLGEGLAMCERRDIFVSHEAYGYLAARYDLQQEGLSGLDPEAEPSPARMREIRDLVSDTGATTVFTESLVSASVAESLAEDAGITTQVLDPVESVVDGDDYIQVMTRNLESLRTGLDCS